MLNLIIDAMVTASPETGNASPRATIRFSDGKRSSVALELEAVSLLVVRFRKYAAG